MRYNNGEEERQDSMDKPLMRDVCGTVRVLSACASDNDI